MELFLRSTFSIIGAAVGGAVSTLPFHGLPYAKTGIRMLYRGALQGAICTIAVASIARLSAHPWALTALEDNGSLHSKASVLKLSQIWKGGAVFVATFLVSGVVASIAAQVFLKNSQFAISRPEAYFNFFLSTVVTVVTFCSLPDSSAK